MIYDDIYYSVVVYRGKVWTESVDHFIWNVNRASPVGFERV